MTDAEQAREKAILEAARVLQSKWLYWDIMSDPARRRVPMDLAVTAPLMNATWDCWDSILRLIGKRAPCRGESMELLVSAKSVDE